MLYRKRALRRSSFPVPGGMQALRLSLPEADRRQGTAMEPGSRYWDAPEGGKRFGTENDGP